MPERAELCPKDQNMPRVHYWVEAKQVNEVIAVRATSEAVHERCEVEDIEIMNTKSPQMWRRVSSVPR